MTSAFSERVAANVRAELARHSMSQTDLAVVLGTTQQAVSRRMSGRVPFDTDELAAIARALNVSLAVLIPAEVGGAA